MNTIMDNLGSCRSCGKSIRWLKTTEGKNMPVDAETTAPDDTLFDGKRHVSHFATCPNAAQHRKVSKKPCGCNEKKKTENLFPNMLQHETTKTVSVDERA